MNIKITNICGKPVRALLGDGVLDEQEEILVDGKEVDFTYPDADKIFLYVSDDIENSNEDSVIAKIIDIVLSFLFTLYGEYLSLEHRVRDRKRAVLECKECPSLDVSIVRVDEEDFILKSKSVNAVNYKYVMEASELKRMFKLWYIQKVIFHLLICSVLVLCAVNILLKGDVSAYGMIVYAIAGACVLFGILFPWKKGRSEYCKLREQLYP